MIMNRLALCSPDPKLCPKYLQHVLKNLESFLGGRQTKVSNQNEVFVRIFYSHLTYQIKPNFVLKLFFNDLLKIFQTCFTHLVGTQDLAWDRVNTTQVDSWSYDTSIKRHDKKYGVHAIFHVFGRSGGCRIFWQKPHFDLKLLFDVLLKNFLNIFYTCCRYLGHSLGSGEHNASRFMIIRYFNQDT